MPRPRFLNQLEILRALYKSNPLRLEYILQHIDSDIIESISEIALNILKGIINLNPQRFKNLKKYSTYIKQLAKKSISLRRKKKILTDNPKLVSQILGALFAKLIGRKDKEKA